jgi:hypothetical protein
LKKLEVASNNKPQAHQLELNAKADKALQKFELSGDITKRGPEIIRVAPPTIQELKDFRLLMEFESKKAAALAQSSNASESQEKEITRKKIEEKKRELKLKRLKEEEDELRKLFDDFNTPVDSAAEQRMKVEARKRMLLNNRNNASSLSRQAEQQEEMRRRIERRKAEILVERRKLLENIDKGPQ